MLINEIINAKPGAAVSDYKMRGKSAMRVTANSMSKKSMGGLDEAKKTIIEGVDPSQFEEDIIDEEEETGVDVVAIK